MLTNIHGHTRVVTYLRELISGTQPLPSCILFHGPDGVGKKTLALSVAKVLNCRADQEADCTCLSCEKIGGNHHLDVSVYAPDGKTFKIDQVRDLLEDADRNRMEGEYRVFILEDAHLLNEQAADALLKTLEDGRPNTVFILLARAKSEIIPTLVGRSLEFYMGFLSQTELLAALSDLGHTGSKAKSAALLSSGSVSAALFYLEGDGFSIRDDVLGLLSDYPRVKDFRIIMKINEYEERFDEFLEVLYALVSDLCLAQRGLTTFLQNQDRQKQLEQLADQFGPKCFNAFYQVRDMRLRQKESVAFEHHVKATLLNLKDVLR